MYDKIFKIFELVAAILTIISIIVTWLNSQDIKIFGISNLKDPFFLFYFLCVFFFLTCLYFVGNLSLEKSQKLEIFGYIFFLVASLVSLTVLWRFVSIVSYSQDETLGIPFGLCSKGNFIYYVILLGIKVILSILIIIRNTTVSNSKCLRQYVILCIYLLFCRIIWEIIDNFGKRQTDIC